MRPWIRAVLVIVLLLALSQIPFAYRRIRLGRLRSQIRELNSDRLPNAAGDRFTDFAGVIHVHSSLGGHSSGTLEDVVTAASANHLDFVVMTEHPSAVLDTAQMTLNGVHNGVLFVAGNEIVYGDKRLLIFPGGLQQISVNASVLAQAKAEGKLIFLAYPEHPQPEDLNSIDGIEIYNIYTNAQKVNYGVLFFDGLWSFAGYHDLLWTTFYQRPGESLVVWDQLIEASGLRVPAISGNDAHANIGLSLRDSSEHTLAGLQLDPYKIDFAVVRNHVLLQGTRPLTQESLVDALRQGHAYTSFDLLCNGSGFRFYASNLKEGGSMGDEVSLVEGLALTIRTPVKATVKVFKDGSILETIPNALISSIPINQRGAYRAEVYLSQLPGPAGTQPWIISNPIYVRETKPAAPESAPSAVPGG